MNYRREDVPDAVGRMHDKLATTFGETNVFRDVDAVPFGENFGEFIASVIAKCRVFLVLIGPTWAATFAKRRGDFSDWVRIELEIALKTPNVEVIPVLLCGAALPNTEQLPESLRPLLRLNAATVRRDPDFHRDMTRLITSLSARGVQRSDEGSSAASFWREVSQTEDIDDLRRFIETFREAPQALEARRRHDQLVAIRLLRRIAVYVEFAELEEDDAARLLIDGVDAFKRCWPETCWDDELARLKELAMESLDHPYYYDHDHPAYDAIPADTLASWRNRAEKFVATFDQQ